ncbi:MAG: DUF4494 domain-containing protein [Prevotellaceae bacterium]|nr:DUF4494 domain-containing protein [Prevotellaceae bacterium]
MRSRTAEWFETKIRYEKTMEDGLQKKVTEAYVVDALSFTEAEETIIKEMSSYISGEFNVTDIKKAAYKEVFFSDNPQDDRWYKAKLQFIIIDEKSGKEKLTAVNYLVQSNTLQNAINNVETVMNTGMQDWKLASVAETTLMDVFEHDGSKHVNKPVEDDRPEYEDAMAEEMRIAAEEQEATTQEQ